MRDLATDLYPKTSIFAAGLRAGLKKIELPGVDFAGAKQFAQAALQATQKGTLGYAILMAQKP